MFRESARNLHSQTVTVGSEDQRDSLGYVQSSPFAWDTEQVPERERSASERERERFWDIYLGSLSRTKNISVESVR